ncbi:MAG: hypothetical protein JW738_04775 [Actinobacteria bacterium]|nr:hypothetical protein [Actinomycetota bacterium]
MGLRDYKIDIKSNRNILALLILVLISLMLWILVSFTCAFFAALLLACMIWNIEARYTLMAALSLICVSAVILAFNQYKTGELVATWGFFLFAVGVTLALARLLRRPVED